MKLLFQKRAYPFNLLFNLLFNLILNRAVIGRKENKDPKRFKRLFLFQQFLTFPSQTRTETKLISQFIVNNHNRNPIDQFLPGRVKPEDKSPFVAIHSTTKALTKALDYLKSLSTEDQLQLIRHKIFRHFEGTLSTSRTSHPLTRKAFLNEGSRFLSQ
ncbi:MAG: hypothetical protein M3367_17135 [Acidobacteriota bacterium]|nr:hypothetical protein [Acidobacteriota bacterium]